MSKPEAAGEPSMEEILASIRKIISEEPPYARAQILAEAVTVPRHEPRGAAPSASHDDTDLPAMLKPKPEPERPGPLLGRIADAIRGGGASQPVRKPADDDIASLISNDLGDLLDDGPTPPTSADIPAFAAAVAASAAEKVALQPGAPGLPPHMPAAAFAPTVGESGSAPRLEMPRGDNFTSPEPPRADAPAARFGELRPLDEFLADNTATSRAPAEQPAIRGRLPAFGGFAPPVVSSPPQQPASQPQLPGLRQGGASLPPLGDFVPMRGEPVRSDAPRIEAPRVDPARAGFEAPRNADFGGFSLHVPTRDVVPPESAPPRAPAVPASGFDTLSAAVPARDFLLPPEPVADSAPVARRMPDVAMPPPAALAAPVGASGPFPHAAPAAAAAPFLAPPPASVEDRSEAAGAPVGAAPAPSVAAAGEAAVAAGMAAKAEPVLLAAMPDPRPAPSKSAASGPVVLAAMDPFPRPAAPPVVAPEAAKSLQARLAEAAAEPERQASATVPPTTDSTPRRRASDGPITIAATPAPIAKPDATATPLTAEQPPVVSEGTAPPPPQAVDAAAKRDPAPPPHMPRPMAPPPAPSRASNMLPPLAPAVPAAAVEPVAETVLASAAATAAEPPAAVEAETQAAVASALGALAAGLAASSSKATPEPASANPATDAESATGAHADAELPAVAVTDVEAVAGTAAAEETPSTASAEPAAAEGPSAASNADGEAVVMAVEPAVVPPADSGPGMAAAPEAVEAKSPEAGSLEAGSPVLGSSDAVAEPGDAAPAAMAQSEVGEREAASTAEAAAPTASSAAVPAEPQPEPAPVADAPQVDALAMLSSAMAASSASGAMVPARAASTAVAHDGVEESTLDDTVAELLRPMLRQWLSDNMPRIVEKALRIELAQSLKRPPADRY